MSNAPLRVLVIGLGRHATKTVLPAIAGAPRWALAGVVSSRPKARAEIGSEYGVASYHSSAAAIAGERPDAVYVASVPADHVTTCRTAIEAGVGVVVCEKPLGVSEHEALELLAVARRNGVLLAEVMAYQHHPQFRAVEEAIGGEEVGDLAHGYARFSYPAFPADDHRLKAAAGGGALLDAGVYPLSMAVRLLGTADVDVQATLSRGDGEVDVAGTATLTDRRGRSFQCSWQMGSAYANLARIVGTAGSIEVARPFSKPASFDEPVVVIGGWGERTTVAYPGTDQFGAMLDDLAEHHTDPEWVESVHRQIEDRWSVIGRVLDTS